MPRLFVSHATSDRAIVSEFVNTVLRLGCGLMPEEIFYSSGADMGVPSGGDLNAYIRSQVSESDLVLAIITPRFQASLYCVAELGAAWSRAGTLLPLLGTRTTPVDLKGVLHGLLVRNIGDAVALDELLDRVVAIFGRAPSGPTWGAHRDEWLRRADGFMQTLEATGSGMLLSATACARSNDHMELFWTDGTGRTFHRWWTDQSGWSSVCAWNDPPALYVAAVSRKEGDEVLFGLSPQGHVWMRTWRVDDRGWTTAGDPQWIEGTVVGPLTAVSRAPWHIELTAWTSEGEQCHNWRHDDTWHGWTTTLPRQS
jgi:hypothetical protein